MPRQHNHQPNSENPENISAANNTPPTPLHHGNGAPMPGKAPTKEAGQTDVDVPPGRPSANWSDAQLLAYAQNHPGDETAFGTFYGRYRAQLKRYARRVVGSQDLAEESTAAAWDCFWQRLQKRTLKLNRNAKSLLFCITRNKAVDARRKQPRPKTTGLANLEESLPDTCDPNRGRVPPDLLNILKCHLSAKECQALCLIYEGWTSAEIAREEGVKGGVIRKRLYQARVKVKNLHLDEFFR